MLPAFLFLLLCGLCQVNGESDTAPWPLFEFWNPLTWINPKLSAETIFQIFRAGRESNRKIYQQLKKALLPANLFFGNIRAQFAAWDSGKEKKLKKSNGSRRPNNKKVNKKSFNRHQ